MAEPSPDGMRYADPGDLFDVRAFVRSAALALGLAPGRVDLLLLAVNELTMNTLQHTSDGGRVLVRAEPGQVVCDVIDRGPPRTFGPMPPAESPRGRGLAIVATIADELSTSAGPEGTRVEVRMNLA